MVFLPLRRPALPRQPAEPLQPFPAEPFLRAVEAIGEQEGSEALGSLPWSLLGRSRLRGLLEGAASGGDDGLQSLLRERYPSVLPGDAEGYLVAIRSHLRALLQGDGGKSLATGGADSASPLETGPPTSAAVSGPHLGPGGAGPLAGAQSLEHQANQAATDGMVRLWGRDILGTVDLPAPQPLSRTGLALSGCGGCNSRADREAPAATLQPAVDVNGIPAARGKLKLNYRAANVIPVTGKGRFDVVEYNSERQCLTITIRPKFVFKGLQLDQYPLESRNDPAARRRLEQSIEEKKQATITAFKLQAEGWGGHHVFYCHEPGLETLKASVRIEVEEVKADEPPSSQTTDTLVTVADRDPGFRSHAGPGDQTLDLGLDDDVSMAYDPETNTMRPQPRRPAIDLRQPGEFEPGMGPRAGAKAVEEQSILRHELGHLFGLGDEYVEPGKQGHQRGDPVLHGDLVKKELNKTIVHGGNPESIMATGNTIGAEHGVTFLAALRTVTQLSWGFDRSQKVE